LRRRLTKFAVTDLFQAAILVLVENVGQLHGVRVDVRHELESELALRYLAVERRVVHDQLLERQDSNEAKAGLLPIRVADQLARLDPLAVAGAHALVAFDVNGVDRDSPLTVAFRAVQADLFALPLREHNVVADVLLPGDGEADDLAVLLDAGRLGVVRHVLDRLVHQPVGERIDLLDGLKQYQLFHFCFLFRAASQPS
jgi:hypothetical protein